MLKDGRLIQVGTPGELYHSPKTSFVAGFIGQTNLFAGISAEANSFETAAGRITVKSSMPIGRSVTLSIRPEQIRIVKSEATPGPNRLTGKVMETTFLGESSEHVLLVNEQRIKVISTPPLFSAPEELTVEFSPEDVAVLSE